MEKLRHANSFRDLKVYLKAQAVAKIIFEVTKSFPREEMYSLTDQVRRSSRSIGAQIAEGCLRPRGAE
jgi:four helix bundle protein